MLSVLYATINMQVPSADKLRLNQIKRTAPVSNKDSDKLSGSENLVSASWLQDTCRTNLVLFAECVTWNFLVRIKIMYIYPYRKSPQEMDSIIAQASSAHE